MPSGYIQGLPSFPGCSQHFSCLHPAPHLPPLLSQPPHCRLHPSEVNSLETFLGSNFHFLLCPLRRPSSVLSGSLQQGRQLTLAWNSRGDRVGGPAPRITIRALRPFGMPAKATCFTFHIGVIKMIFHAGPYLLSRPNIQMQPYV